MKNHHITIVLAIIFLTGLIVLWWAPTTEIDPGASGAILPALNAIPVADIKRLEIDRPKKGKIVVERRDEGRWQLREPVDAAADPSLVETLARNLKDMRKSLDAGTIHDPPETFGLAEPSAVVRVFGSDPKVPLATLDIGKTVRELLYVRSEGIKGIEVIDPRLLSMLDLAAVDWRDKSLFHLPSFRVGTLAVSGSGRELTAERDEGHWHLVRPFRALAEDEKVEGTVAELTSLRVAKGDAGFVANDVKDEERAKYGLDQPTMTVELKPGVGPGKPQTLVVGKPRPDVDQSDLHYARAGDQDDVVLVDLKDLRDLGLDPNAFRSHKVAELNPARVEFVRIEAFGRTFDLSRTSNGWEQLRPTREEADASTVQRFLNKLGEAQASDFLDPSKFPQSGIDPPRMTIKVWQAGPRAKAALGLDSPPKAEPSVHLAFGNQDALRKSIYARVEGDRSLLAIPDTLVEALPSNPLAFRERTVLTLSPARIGRLKIYREGKTYELAAPVESGKSTRWRMVAPVEAPADQESVTRMVTLLSQLTAEAFVTDQAGDGKAYGFNAPSLTVTWRMIAEPASAKAKDKDKDKDEAKDQTQPGNETGTLRIGTKVPKTDLSYATIEGSPIVFTLQAAQLEPFESEFHTHRVMSFDPAEVSRLVLRWPDLTLSFKPRESPASKGILWVPESDANIKGLDLSRLGNLIATLAKLHTPRFVQYRGSIPAGTGLAEPRLVIELHLGGDKGTRVLRLGRSDAEQTYATTAGGSSGPVFFVTGPAWPDLIRSAPREGELPGNVFTPKDGKTPEKDAKAAGP